MRHTRVVRWLWLLLACACTGFGVLGILIPGLPTVPFLLLASWAATHGSPRFHAWLHAHPRLAPLLRDWERERAISRRAKMAAIVLLAISWGLLAWHLEHVLLACLLGALFLGVGTFILSRPTPGQY